MEPRELVIAHQSVWDALTQFFDAKGCDLLLVIEGDDDNLPAYIVSPREV